jgi:hypothetical protein
MTTNRNRPRNLTPEEFEFEDDQLEKADEFLIRKGSFDPPPVR